MPSKADRRHPVLQHADKLDERRLSKAEIMDLQAQASAGCIEYSDLDEDESDFFKRYEQMLEKGPGPD